MSIGDFIKRTGLRAVYRSYERDLNEVIARIKGMDAAEIGLVLAVAADVRNAVPVLNETLFDLHALAGPDSMMLPLQMSQRIQELQRQKLFVAAAAWMVWLHTVHAAQHQQLRYLAKQMWGELERGFPYVEDCAQEFEAVGNGTLVTIRGTEFPAGLNPHL
jgi:hypothetical protein